MKKWVKRISVFFISLIFSLFLLEFGVRVLLYTSLSSYFNTHIKKPYRNRMKKIHLVKREDWYKLDPKCIILPKEKIFLENKDYPIEKKSALKRKLLMRLE